ncbi:hypothetical protein HOI18_04085 [Candidatus Uhrbacteria bacterium]|jgi:hypothetical protein|nr:hypothetical protein [Candidatus Uhrbacteria bacterium]
MNIFDSGPGINRTLKTVVGRDGRSAGRNYTRTGTTALTGGAGGITLALHQLGDLDRLTPTQQEAAVSALKAMCERALSALGEDTDDGSYKPGTIVQIVAPSGFWCCGIVLSDRPSSIRVRMIGFYGDLTVKSFPHTYTIEDRPGFKGLSGLVRVMVRAGLSHEAAKGLHHVSDDHELLTELMRSDTDHDKMAIAAASVITDREFLLETLRATEINQRALHILMMKLDPETDMETIKQLVLSPEKTGNGDEWWTLHGYICDAKVAVDSMKAQLSAASYGNDRWHGFQSVTSALYKGTQRTMTQVSELILWYVWHLKGGVGDLEDSETEEDALNILKAHPDTSMAQLGLTIEKALQGTSSKQA